MFTDFLNTAYVTVPKISKFKVLIIHTNRVTTVLPGVEQGPRLKRVIDWALAASAGAGVAHTAVRPQVQDQPWHHESHRVGTIPEELYNIHNFYKLCTFIRLLLWWDEIIIDI